MFALENDKWRNSHSVAEMHSTLGSLDALDMSSSDEKEQ